MFWESLKSRGGSGRCSTGAVEGIFGLNFGINYGINFGVNFGIESESKCSGESVFHQRTMPCVMNHYYTRGAGELV